MTTDEKRLAEIRRDIDGYEPGDARMAASDLLAMLDTTRERAEDAERNLSALTKLARRAVALAEQDDPEVWPACDAMGAAIADVATVAERHDREVRVKELRRMSYKARAEFLGIAEAGPASVWASCARWLRDEADRIERGEA